MGGYHDPSPWRVKNTSIGDANYNTLQTHEIPNNETLMLKAQVSLYKTSDGSKAGGWEIQSTFKNVGGTVTQLDPDEINVYRIRPSSAYDLRFTPSGTTVLLELKAISGIEAHSRVERC